MDQKEKAITFLKLAGTGKVQEAFDQFVAPNFIHHNPYFKGSRTALKVAMEEAHNTDPNNKIEVIHIYQDGNTVITQSHIVKTEMELAVVHTFRFEEGKIAELWDLGQVIEKNSPNENGIF